MLIFLFAFVLHATNIIHHVGAAEEDEEGEGGGGLTAMFEAPDIIPYNVTGTPCANTSEADEVWCSLWMINTDKEVAVFIEQEGEFPIVNVEAVTVLEGEEGSASVITVYTSGVPNYQVTATSDLLDELNGRPFASRDFLNGSTTVDLDTVIEFGQNIGYQDMFCEHGFWPPGPGCPENHEKDLQFPTTPSEPATVADANQCFMTLDTVGLFINGVSMVSWSDAFTYNNELVWHNQAAYFEIYDLDICDGHAALGLYHHHTYSRCVRDMVNDDGSSGHSPIVGMTPDGYFHYGMYQSTGVKTHSCWKARDYSDPDDPLGCGGTGQRTCVLVDNLDPSLGTVDASLPGPDDDEVIVSLSSNTFIAVTGSYYEDWYFDADCYAQGGEYLDEHNGHSHDDLGYHYHATETFPWFVGPTTYYGQVNVPGWQCGGYDWDPKVQAQIDRQAEIASEEEETEDDEDEDEEESSESRANSNGILFSLIYVFFVGSCFMSFC